MHRPHFLLALLGLLLGLATATPAAAFYRTITVDGAVTDWTGIPSIATDVTGDGGAGGRDIKAVYLCNDELNLYVRIESFNANDFDGNEFGGIDGDNNAATGFNLFGLGAGSDLLIAGASLYAESTGSFNAGAANPSGINWGPFATTTDLELAIPLSTTLTGGDIAAAFPGGLGSTISFVFGDGNGDGGDTIAAAPYTLSLGPPSFLRTIVSDGNVADWAGVTPAATDVSGDGGTGRDVQAIYLANDAVNLYVRIQSYNSDAFDGNEFGGIDGDNNTATGFNLFGLGAGSDMLIAGASLYGESTGNFNTGAATPGSINFGPFVAATDIEYEIPLNTILPAGSDILTAFPGGAGSLISFVFGDSNGGATDTVSPVIYRLASSNTETILADFEFATDTAGAQAGVTTAIYQTSSVTVDAATTYTEGSAALSIAATYAAEAYGSVSVRRDRPAPYGLSRTYSNATSPALGDLALRIDLKGDPTLGTGASDGTNLFILLNDEDGDIFRFINFTEPAIGSAAFTRDLRVAFFDRQGAGDGSLTTVTAATILLENPNGLARTGTIVVDNLRVEEPVVVPPTLGYAVPLITPAQAPNVTDSSFDAIYANGSVHPAITGNDWKDWAQRGADPYAPIGGVIGSTSRAYLLTDGTYLYFGMVVYDPNTAAMTADTGDDTVTKWMVEDIEVAFSSNRGVTGATDAAKFAMDAFGHIDDMIPDGAAAVDTTAKVNSNSYVINSTTWACEFRVGLSELVGNTALATPLPPAPGPWYAHVGYQSAGRVPLYAAAHGNGFANFQIELDLSSLIPNAAQHWEQFE